MNLARTTLVAALALAAARPALAQPKPKPACNIRSLPLMVGNTWTYRSGDKQTSLRIAEITNGKDDAGKPITWIKVEERYDNRSLTLLWSCTPRGGIVMPPESFLFSGEPGGGIGMAFTYTSHEGQTYVPDNLYIPETGWVEKVTADAVRNDVSGQGANHPPAKLEMERHLIVQQRETVTVPAGEITALKVAFDLRGRGIIEGEKVEIPILRPGAFWLAKDVGVVKYEDAFKKTWELVATNLTLPTPKKK